MKFGRIVPRVKKALIDRVGFSIWCHFSRWRPRHHFTKKPKAPSFQTGSKWNLARMLLM